MRDQLKVTLCVDALEPKLGGIGRYVWELARRLPTTAGVSSVRFFSGGQLVDPDMLVRGETAVNPGRMVAAVKRWHARQLLRRGLVHAPNYFLPPTSEHGIVTVHDLSVFRFPETHPSARIAQFELLFEDSLSRASHIITDTKTVRLELIDMFGISPEKVTPVPLGVSGAFHPRPRAELSKRLEALGLSAGGYGLCVSTLEPRKKILQAIHAWRRLPLALRDRFPLVLAGCPGWENDPLIEQIENAASEGWLRALGYVADSELPYLYAGAAVFVYLSSYEGFGLPPVEAMASGVPIVVANRSCLPEVCGEAAQYVNPDDEAEVTAAVKHCLEDDDLRAQRIRQGLDQAARYTWERCLEDTVGVYRRVDAAGRGRKSGERLTSILD